MLRAGLESRAPAYRLNQQLRHIRHAHGLFNPGVFAAIAQHGLAEGAAGGEKDPEAPIFEAAQYGVLGDVQAVLPRLIEAVKSHRSGG